MCVTVANYWFRLLKLNLFSQKLDYWQGFTYLRLQIWKYLHLGKICYFFSQKRINNNKINRVTALPLHSFFISPGFHSLLVLLKKSGNYYQAKDIVNQLNQFKIIQKKKRFLLIKVLLDIGSQTRISFVENHFKNVFFPSDRQMYDLLQKTLLMVLFSLCLSTGRWLIEFERFFVSKALSIYLRFFSQKKLIIWMKINGGQSIWLDPILGSKKNNFKNENGDSFEFSLRFL